MVKIMQLQKLKNKKFYIPAIIVLIVGAGIYLKAASGPAAVFTTANVVKGKLIQSVSETGTVRAASELDLSFLNSGKVAKILVKIGDQVVKDQVLSELDYGQLAIKEQQAQANLLKLIKGASVPDIAVAEASVRQAESAYRSALTDLEKTKKTVAESIAQAKKNLSDLENHTAQDVTNYEQAVTTAEVNLDNAKQTYEQALNNRIDSAISTADNTLSSAGVALDNINKILTDDDAKNLLSVKNSSYLAMTQTDYADAKNLIEAANLNLSSARQSKTVGDSEATMASVISALKKTAEALDDCYKVLENTIVSSTFLQASLDAYKTAISGQQSSISGAIASAESGKQSVLDAELSYETNVASANNALTQANVSLDNALVSAKNAYNSALLTGDQQNASAQSRADASLKAWELAKSQLAKIKAPARAEDMALAQADLNTVKAQISNSIIKAPIDGIITKINYEIGEDVSLSQPFISMLGNNNLYVEILVSEADISKVKNGQSAAITFDAFSSDMNFKGEIYFIEPAETIVQGVVYYKVKVMLADMDDVEKKYGLGVPVKSGMTANVVITTAEKSDILIIPARAVVEKSGGLKIVRVLVENKVTEVPVQIGLRGDEGLVEVSADGLKAGDSVVTAIK